MIVVSNTSPILSLGQIHQLTLLEHIYGTIIVPQAVYNEATVGGPGRHWAAQVQNAAWIQTQQVKNQADVNSLMISLNRGEAEAIVLATELGADLLLIDERLGRNEAMKQGINHTGVLGVLLDAKRTKLIQEIKPTLDDLIFHAGFWVSKNLYMRVLQRAGE